MISVGKLTSGPAAVAYYVDQVARGRDDYYAGQREAPGEWIGTGAAELGWRGEVDADAFGKLLDGAGLRTPPREGAVAGFDLTFRAPKSVSVVWAIADPDVAGQLRAAHDAAVREALGYLERDAVWARRGHGGLTQVPGVGFVGAAFTHHASRAGDPLLHTHVVVGNLTRGPDDRWTALDARHLYRLSKTAGYLYQAELRREATERLGLEWTPVRNGVADLADVPRAVIEHFSQRRREILEHMAAHGAHSAAAAQVAALETRRAKNEPPLVQQLADWRARAAEHGLTARMLDRLIGRRLVVELPVSIDIQSLTETASTFGRPDMLRALAEAQPAGATIGQLEAMADRILTDPEVVRLDDATPHAGVVQARYTTRELLGIEHELIAGSLERRGVGVAIATVGAVGQALDGRALTDEQAEVVLRLSATGSGVVVVRAAAGTGKTFALDAAHEAWRASGIEVFGTALSARAALELHDQTAIPTRTIAQTLHALDHGHTLPRNGVLVVDEAGMVGTRHLARLANAAREVDAKLVLVGDDRQLREIQAGGAFRALADQLDAVELHEVLRQRQAWDRQALTELRDGQVERWARAYRDRGQITIAPNAERTRAALVNDWARASGDRLIIAQRRDDVADLNHRVRELRQHHGDLAPDQLTAGGRRYSVGDQVIGLRNDRSVGILNGQRGQITHVDRERESVTVQLAPDKTVEIPSTYLAEGYLDHGYAITAHRAQGTTVDRTFVLGSETSYREWGYTALSRHRDEARFYIARDQIDPDRRDRDLPPQPRRDYEVERLTRLLSRSEPNELAIHSVRQADRDQLEREHNQLRHDLDQDPPPLAPADTFDRDVDHARRHLNEATERLSRNQDERDSIGWHHRQARRELDDTITANRRAVAHHADKLAQAVAERDQAHQREQAWLHRNRPEAQRFLAITHELRDRAPFDHHADQALAAYQHELATESRIPDLDRLGRNVDRAPAPDRLEPDPFERHPLEPTPPPQIHRDIAPDFDFGP